VTAANSLVSAAVHPLTVNIGAEITGIDAGGSPSDEEIELVHQALLDHKVVFLRDQHLDYESEIAFAKRFGPLTLGHPTIPSPEGYPLLEEIDSQKGGPANRWHTDVTFLDRPPAYTFLHGVVIPEVGGDTIWANSVTAYEVLPDSLRELANNLRVIHSNAYDYGAATSDPKLGNIEYRRRRDVFVSTVYKTEHPAVRVHPETGERGLLLGSFAESVVGYSRHASREILQLLHEYVVWPEHTVRWRWRQGDLAIWDNRATEHVAVYDYGEAHRRGERVTVAGPVVVGVDGRPAVLLQGDAASYYAGAA
jgi:alpha-ketoglutarate-dependent taurine dioxygenase